MTTPPPPGACRASQLCKCKGVEMGGRVREEGRRSISVEGWCCSARPTTHAYGTGYVQGIRHMPLETLGVRGVKVHAVAMVWVGCRVSLIASHGAHNTNLRVLPRNPGAAAGGMGVPSRSGGSMVVPWWWWRCSSLYCDVSAPMSRLLDPCLLMPVSA